jgi:hypothetical protein
MAIEPDKGYSRIRAVTRPGSVHERYAPLFSMSTYATRPTL